MKLRIVLSSLAIVGLAGSSLAQPASWSIAIGTTPTTFSCGGRKIPVPASGSCDTALAVAREVFTAARACSGACRNAALEAGAATCKTETFKQPKGVTGRRFRVSFSWKCRRVPFDTVPPHRGCDEAAVMRDDKPVIPSGATEVEGPEDVDEDLGLISSLYSGQDTSTDGFYPLPCEPSIGGTLPPDVPPTQDELDADATLEAFESGQAQELAQQLQSHPMPAISLMQTLPGLECAFHGQLVPCDSPLLLMKDQPFEGRDIIYVHGLALTHLKDRLQNPPPSSHPANATWPQNPSEFLDAGKYYRSYAEAYWHDHIQENLFDPNQPSNPVAGWEWWSGGAPAYRPHANRYLIVSWSSNQTIEYAQHALLTQIQLAITANKNVVTPPTYPSSSVFRPFCANGCILISHSTGALIVDSAMGLADAGFFGPGGKQITRRMTAHVSLEGAISGSRLASIGMAVALAAVPIAGGANVLCGIADLLFGTNNSCSNADTVFVSSSILRDLIPLVSQTVWGPAVDATPVPTLTVAGGHPLGNFGGSTKPYLPGLDDGVVSMNSACGNPNLVLPGVIVPSGFAVLNPVRAFDFSTDPARFARATKNWLSHKNLKALPPLFNYLAGACTPYVTPTGMVMPAMAALRNTPWDTRKRYRNHYSLLQGSIDHSYDPGDSSNRWPSALGQGAGVVRTYTPFFTANVEESSAVTDSAIYGVIDGNGTHLVHPSFARIHEVVRGRRIRFKLFGRRRTIWIWKRTYHLLEKWEVKQSSHYVYEFVARR